MKMKTRVIVLALLALVVALVPTGVLAQGCAMCRTALEGQEADPLTQAFNVEVLFLIATPYTIVGTFGLCLVLAARRRARRPLEPEAADLPLE